MPIYLKDKVSSTINPIDFTMQMDKKTHTIKNINTLKEVIDSRLEKKELITPEALALIIEKSGGNIRQLLNIVQTASTEAELLESDVIDIDEVKSALEQIGGNLSTRVQFKSKFLKKIRDTHALEEEDKADLAETLRDGLVYAYFNGQAYYAINPIVEDLL